MIESVLSALVGTFTVDVDLVKVDVNAVADPVIFKEPSGAYKVQAKDNILFKSIALVFPYCFCQADDRASLDFSYYNTTTATHFPLEEIGNGGRVWFFSENVEIPSSIFWRWRSEIAGEAFTYFAARTSLHINPPDTGNSEMSISMLNVPAGLDEVELPIFSFIKIVHTLPIIV